jgi:protein gp37
MAERSKIEWTDHTFNPWIGCTRISPGCDNCYAADMAHRYGWAEFVTGAPRHRTSASYWRQPLRWNRQAEANGVRKKVFPSLCDPFDAEVDRAWRRDLVDLIHATPWLIWLLLTKRPHLAGKYWAELDMPANVWLGTSVENQTMAELRVPQLLEVPAKVRFLSCEPLLGPIDLTAICTGHHFIDALSGHRYHDHDSPTPSETKPCAKIDWVIAGGESGPKARAPHPDWIRSLARQCIWSDERLGHPGTPFFFKQWGEWAPSTEKASAGNPRSGWRMLRGHPHLPRPEELYPDNGAAFVARVGKKAAGALLDGVEHRAFPQ